VDHESGRKGRKEREAFDRMPGAAENRAFDVLVFWSLDRFARGGIRKTISEGVKVVGRRRKERR
jgi:DNA invertase Pin-like site-specific DNA recombinase